MKKACFALLIGASGQACVVRAYQPMSGFHRPLVVDVTRQNFLEAAVDVHCLRGPLLSGAEAQRLCQRVGTLLENQGADVRAYVSGSREDAPSAAARAAPDPEEPAEEAVIAETEADPPARLTLELRARETHTSTHPISWILFVGSFTLAPGVIESSFAQDVVIRDGSGFLLLSDTLEGRLVTRYGVGPWVGNQLLNLTRQKGEKLDKEVASRDLSNDLYGQLSQDVFNAWMHARVLEQAPPSVPQRGAR